MKNGKILKRIGILFLGYIIMMTGVSGCMQKNKLSINACLSYMKDKYGTEFTLVEGEEVSQLTASMLEIYVKSADYPEEKVLVVEERLDNGNSILFHDNYVAVRYRQEAKNLAEKMAEDVFGECRVLYKVDDTLVQPDEFDNTTTFEEFISDRASNIYFDVLVPPEHSDNDKESELKKLEQLCIENRFVCICDVWYSTDEEVYWNSNSNVELMKARLDHRWYTENGQFIMDNDFTVYHEMWR